MERQYVSVTNGIFTFTETDIKNEFLFYRNDGNVLGKISREPVELYYDYMINKMFNGEIDQIVRNDINYPQYSDAKFIKVIITNNESATNKGTGVIKKQPNLFQKLIKKFFG